MPADSDQNRLVWNPRFRQWVKDGDRLDRYVWSPRYRKWILDGAPANRVWSEEGRTWLRP